MPAFETETLGLSKIGSCFICSKNTFGYFFVGLASYVEHGFYFYMMAILRLLLATFFVGLLVAGCANNVDSMCFQSVQAEMQFIFDCQLLSVIIYERHNCVMYACECLWLWQQMAQNALHNTYIG